MGLFYQGSMLSTPRGISGPGAGSSINLNTGLVEFWKLASVNGEMGVITLTNNGTATFVAGKIGNAVDLNGTDQWLSAADNANTRFNSAAWTVGGWFFPDVTTSGMQLVCKRDFAGILREIEISTIAGPKIRCEIFNGISTTRAQINSSNNYTQSAWNFFCVRFDPTVGANGTVYLRLATTDQTPVALSGASATSAAGLGIGALADGLGGFFNGKFDAVGKWNIKLSDAAVTNLYNSGVGREGLF